MAAYGATAQNLGQVSRRLGRLDRAGELLRLAEGAYRQWIAAEPDSATPKERLALVRGSIGQHLAASGKLNEAAQAYADKLEILRDLLRQDPQHTRRQADYALGLSYVGELQTRQSNFVAAVATFDEGIKVCDQLVARDSANGEWQMWLVTQLSDRGTALRGAARSSEALESFRRAWEVSEAHADAARQSPDWIANWRRALEGGEQLVRELAAQATAAGKTAEASERERIAGELQAKQRALPK